MPMTQTRRRFVATLSLAGSAALVRVPPALAGEERLETTTLRLLHKPTICGAPQYVAEELLRAEGFTDIRYAKIMSSAEVNDAVLHGQADFDAHFAPQWVSAIDGGGAISVLAGVHVGCFELFRE
jgi:NitT/TauT family transport system substrate-binding protein